ncbi:MAG TPA: hypothetical protein VIT38_04445 [Allosphingosinicella sp.]
MPVSFATQIRPMFRSVDINCMSGFDVLLDDHRYMSDPAGSADYPDHANARRVLCYLSPGGCEPRMPMHGPYWSDAQLALYRQWMDDGYLP